MQPVPRGDRRHLLAILGGAALSFVPLLPEREASAGRSWCRVDPIFRIGGARIGDVQDVHLWVAIRWPDMREARRLSSGPVEVELLKPVGIEVERLDDRRGFGDGFAVQIRTDDRLAAGVEVPLRFRVRVPFAEDARAWAYLRAIDRGPVGVGSAHGRTNEWLDFVTS